jgi:hypothetical protein
VTTNVDHISRPLITVDELMRLPGPTKEGHGEAQRIVAPGAMLIFIAGQSPIFGKQLLYFQDPTLRKRSTITPPQTFFTIEHDGNILSAGKLYRTQASSPTSGMIQGPIRVQTATLLDLPYQDSSTASTASNAGGPSLNRSSDKQIPTSQQEPNRGDNEMTEQTKSTPIISQQLAPADEMQEIFAELDEGMEEMDRDFRIYEIQRGTGGSSNER